VSNIHTPITPQSQVHSRAQSQSHSHHSFSGSIIAAGGAPGHQYTQSIQSSLGSPLGFTSGGGLNGFVSTNGNGGGGGGGGGGSNVGFTGVPMPLVESPSQDIVNVSKSDGVGLGISDSYGYLVRPFTRFSLGNSLTFLFIETTSHASCVIAFRRRAERLSYIPHHLS
jgi:hypothetical protein